MCKGYPWESVLLNDRAWLLFIINENLDNFVKIVNYVCHFPKSSSLDDRGIEYAYLKTHHI